MFNRILNIFKQSNLEIKSIQKLEQYIKYCIKNNNQKRIKFETAHHHILPNALFPELSNLRDTPWNGVYLMHFDHYYAHWLLTEALYSPSMLFAFCAMHNKDIKNNRLEEKDLIAKSDFQLKMEERGIYISLNNKRRAKEGTLFGGYKFCRLESEKKRQQTLRKNPDIQRQMTQNQKKTLNDPAWKSSKGKDKVSKWQATRKLKTEDDELRRIEKFKVSFAKSFDKEKHYQKTLKAAKFKNFCIFDKNDNLVYQYEGLLTEFCKNNNLPIQALKKSSRNSPIYASKAGLRNAKIKGWDKYEGYYLVLA